MARDILVAKASSDIHVAKPGGDILVAAAQGSSAAAGAAPSVPATLIVPTIEEMAPLRVAVGLDYRGPGRGPFWLPSVWRSQNQFLKAFARGQTRMFRCRQSKWREDPL